MLPVILFALQASQASISSSREPSQPPRTAEPVAGARNAQATLARKPPVIDGRGDDAIWTDAQKITAFRQFDPVEDGEPPFPTEAKVAYDERYLYVFVRAFDPHPDSIHSYLSRRDTWTTSDRIWVMIDSYHDRRTATSSASTPRA